MAGRSRPGSTRTSQRPFSPSCRLTARPSSVFRSCPSGRSSISNDGAAWPRSRPGHAVEVAGPETDGSPPRRSSLAAHGPGERDPRREAVVGAWSTVGRVLNGRLVEWPQERRVSRELRVRAASGMELVIVSLHLSHVGEGVQRRPSCGRPSPSPTSSHQAASRSSSRATSISSAAEGLQRIVAAGYSPPHGRHRPHPRPRCPGDRRFRVAGRAPDGRGPRPLRPLAVELRVG